MSGQLKIQATLRTLVAQALLVWVGVSPRSLASQDQIYGLGGTTTARVSAVTAETDHPYAALYNPALMAAHPASSFGFSTVVTSTRFDPLPGVADKSAALWSAGVVLPTELRFWPDHRAGFGIVASGPYGNLRHFAAGAPSDFYSLRYGTSDSQFKGTISGSLELVPRRLFLGLGASLFISGSGAADAAVVTTSPEAHLLLDVGLNTAAVSGLYFEAGDAASTRAALVYRQEIHPFFQQVFTGRVQWGQQDILQQPILLTSSLYYEPHSLELEAQREIAGARVSAGLSYQHWNDYKPSYLVMETTDASGQVVRPELPNLSFRNTLSPRVSMELPFAANRAAVAAGYQYRPTPVTDLSGLANIVDTNAHVFGLGVRYRLAAGELLPWPTSWSLFGQHHSLVGRDVTKAQSRFPGAPGYRVRGSSYVVGIAVQAEL